MGCREGALAGERLHGLGSTQDANAEAKMKGDAPHWLQSWRAGRPRHFRRRRRKIRNRAAGRRRLPMSWPLQPVDGTCVN
jgi:hypothetical protein